MGSWPVGQAGVPVVQVRLLVLQLRATTQRPATQATSVAAIPRVPH
jgi:hypothetical protein